METTREILWRADPAAIQHSRLSAFRQWLQKEMQVATPDYETLWQWSVDNPDIFWESIISFFHVRLHTSYTAPLSEDPMPDTKWFSGATLNYAEQIQIGMRDQKTAMLFFAETGDEREVSVDEMWSEVERIRQYLILQGLREGDRVAGFLPNIPEATFAFLATVSLGAVWSCCSPDFGVNSVVERFSQIEPVVFICADGYSYNGKVHDRLAEIAQIRTSLPTLTNTLLIRYKGLDGFHKDHNLTIYDSLPVPQSPVVFKAVPFEHPLWILYSSGTTGAPKAITHSHGGCLLEHIKYLAFHNDVHAGERFFWYTTTGWMMWNFLQGAMMLGATIVLYDGSPGFPDMLRLWRMAESCRISHFGTSAPYLVACMKRPEKPGQVCDLSALRSIGSTGSPLPPEAFDWVYAAIHSGIWLCSMSGGTDVCTAFVGGVLEKPVYRGEIQARGLGCSLYAYNDMDEIVYGEVGEMVITKPMPSMPIYFWNDRAKKRYRASYFEDIEGVWRHGDWVMISEEGGVIILGRSDATLNRHGIRIGTAEIYRVMNEISDVEDSLIVNLEQEGGRHFMPLFVKLQPGKMLTSELKKEIVEMLRTRCSPRHVPDDILVAPDIPYTISGKKMEAPVKKILMGIKADNALSRDAMRNPESLNYFIQLASEQ